MNTTFSGELEPLPFESRHKIEISSQNMERAIEFLKYMQREHLTKLMLFAQSSTGTLNDKDIVLSKALSLLDRGLEVDARSIFQNLSKGQRTKVGGIKKIRFLLSMLVQEGKLNADEINEKFNDDNDDDIPY